MTPSDYAQSRIGKIPGSTDRGEGDVLKIKLGHFRRELEYAHAAGHRQGHAAGYQRGRDDQMDELRQRAGIDENATLDFLNRIWGN